MDAQSHELEKRASEIFARERALVGREKALEEKETVLKKRQALAEQRWDDFDNQVRQGIIQGIADLNDSPLGVCLRSKVFSSIKSYNFKENPRLFSAYSGSFPIHDLSVSATMQGSTGNLYSVSLDSCTCQDFQFNHEPCKHMYRLAIQLGIRSMINHKEMSNGISAQVSDLISRRDTLRDDVQTYRGAMQQLQKRSDALEARIDDFESTLKKLSDTALSSRPWLAEELFDLEYKENLRFSRNLKTKKRPAVKASEKVKELSREVRELKITNKAYSYRLAFYESLFPWLSDVDAPADADALYHYFSDGEAEAPADPLLQWISKAEFDRLSTTEKNQLALNRWRRRKKTDWEIGIEFERYIGYVYEKQGCRVQYNGALEGLRDFGRDLIVTQPDGHVLVIQCKRWASHKTVHEKHIFQLYGSLVSWQLDHPGQSASALMVCTCPLSDDAARFAEYLKIDVNQNYDISGLSDYPLIKCNIGSGGRIYHLPFDQQYDRIRIDYSADEFYAGTVEEAEAAGFRRAWRWAGSHSA